VGGGSLNAAVRPGAYPGPLAFLRAKSLIIIIIIIRQRTFMIIEQDQQPEVRTNDRGSNRLLDMKATAELLGVSHKSLQANWRVWGLPGTRVGKRVQFMERRLLEWIEKHAA
jgi:hypothetical protein